MNSMIDEAFAAAHTPIGVIFGIYTAKDPLISYVINSIVCDYHVDNEHHIIFKNLNTSCYSRISYDEYTSATALTNIITDHIYDVIDFIEVCKKDSIAYPFTDGNTFFWEKYISTAAHSSNYLYAMNNPGIIPDYPDYFQCVVDKAVPNNLGHINITAQIEKRFLKRA